MLIEWEEDYYPIEMKGSTIELSGIFFCAKNLGERFIDGYIFESLSSLTFISRL